MNRVVRIALVAVSVAGLSCARSSSAPKTTPTPTGTGTAAAPAPIRPAGAPTTPGGPPAGGRVPRPPMTPEMRAARRDSINAADAVLVDKLMAQIAGKENASSQDVWQNLELLQDTTAGRLVKLMDEYSRAVGRGCDFCHVVDKWADDSKEHKKTTRIMIAVTNAINNEQLTKLPLDHGSTPKISCMTCHRGANSPNRQIVP